MRTEFSLRMMRLFHHYKAGYLLLAGGVMEQPNKYLEAMEVVGATIAGIERDRFERDRKEAERNAARD